LADLKEDLIFEKISTGRSLVYKILVFVTSSKHTKGLYHHLRLGIAKMFLDEPVHRIGTAIGTATAHQKWVTNIA